VESGADRMKNLLLLLLLSLSTALCSQRLQVARIYGLYWGKGNIKIYISNIASTVLGNSDSKLAIVGEKMINSVEIRLLESD
jgi:hypothetical protein